MPGSLLAGNLIGVVAQRLVRRLCPRCKLPHEADANERRMLAAAPAKPCVIHSPRGCAHCDGIGYRGRLAIAEVLRVDPDIDGLISTEAPIREVQASAVRRGFRPMSEDAIARVIAGDTSLAEVMRVLDLTDRMT